MGKNKGKKQTKDVKDPVKLKVYSILRTFPLFLTMVTNRNWETKHF